MEFVNLEIAKKLQEKGFREKCHKHYYPNSNDWFLSSYPECDNFSSYVDAPTISQVLKWLRDEKSIDIVVYPIDGNTLYMGGERYILSVYLERKRDYKVHHDNIDKYVSYEEAANAGIEYVLDNLI